MTRSWRAPLERAACSLSKLEDETLPRPDRRSRDILPDSAVSADVQRSSLGSAEQITRRVPPGREHAVPGSERETGGGRASQIRHHQHRLLAGSAQLAGDLGATGCHGYQLAPRKWLVLPAQVE